MFSIGDSTCNFDLMISAVLPDQASCTAEGAALPIAGLAALQCLTEAAGLKLDKTGPQANILVT